MEEEVKTTIDDVLDFSIQGIATSDPNKDEESINEDENLEIDDDRLSLTDFFQLCLDFEDDPTDQNMDKIKDFLGALDVREFLPLKEKTLVAVDIIKDLIDEFDVSGSATTLEIGKIFKGLLKYVVNLKNDIGALDKTFVAYDYCHIYGLVDTIQNVCYNDFQRLCSYIDNMINISNAYRLIQTASILNDTEYGKWVQTLKDLKEKITPEMLQSLLAVDVMNNGGDELKDLFGEIAAKQAMSGIEKDKVKYDAIAKDLDNKANHNYTIKKETNETDEEK